ncbi:MAG: carboxypeptidase-like regulatory domain-containing protein [Porphyromonas sp.]|nr:carboxypeptidase-like regulatory domain-containing protein [Porphyromonas sp.]
MRSGAITVLFLVQFFVGCYAAKAQQITITGYVLDRDDKPIELAHVQVKGQVHGSYTNLKGFYSFSMPSTRDSVVLVFSCLGYKSEERKLASLSTDQRINMRLASATIDLGGVIVTATGRKQTSSMQMIKPELIKANVSPTGGVESLVGTYAGVSQNNELSSQYSVRGGSYDENMVYVNGVEVYRPLLIRSAEQEGLSFVNPDLTDQVHFSAGGFTADYGDKISSVLDIKYKKPEETEGSIVAGMMGASAHFGTRQGRLSAVAGLRYKSGSSLLKSLNDTEAEYDPHYFDAQAYLTYALSQKFKLSFLSNVSYTSYRFIPKTRETNFGTIENIKKFKIYFEGKEQDRFLTAFGAFTLEHVPTADFRHSLVLSAFRTREQETYDLSGSYFLNDLGAKDPSAIDGISGAVLGVGNNHEHARNHLYATVANASYRADLSLSEMQRWRAGVEFKFEQVRDYINEWEKRDSMGYTLPRKEELLAVWRNLYSDVHMNSLRVGAFVQDHLRMRTPGGILNMVPGIRLSYWSFNREIILSPRMSTSFAPDFNRNLLFRLSGGLYYQAPFYKELRLVRTDEHGNHHVVLNDRIRSQAAAVLLLGTDLDFLVSGRKFKFTTELYYKRLYLINPYIRDNVKVRYFGSNIGSGYAAGVDFKLFGEFVPGVDSWLTCSLLKAEQNLGEGIGKMPLMNAPKYNVSLFFQDYFPGYKQISLSLRAVLSGGLPEMNPAKGFSAPAFTGSPYRRVDIGMQYTLLDKSDKNKRYKGLWSAFKRIQLGLDVFNLFDIANINSYYWISDVFNQQYAVPNYLTRRQWNLRLSVDF